MRTVWKFPLDVKDGTQIVSMPVGSKIVCVAQQGDCPTIWAEVESVKTLVDRHFVVVGTGHPMPDVPVSHRGTCFHRGGLVWHIYEVAQ